MKTLNGGRLSKAYLSLVTTDSWIKLCVLPLLMSTNSGRPSTQPFILIVRGLNDPKNTWKLISVVVTGLSSPSLHSGSSCWFSSSTKHDWSASSQKKAPFAFVARYVFVVTIKVEALAQPLFPFLHREHLADNGQTFCAIRRCFQQGFRWCRKHVAPALAALCFIQLR